MRFDKLVVAAAMLLFPVGAWGAEAKGTPINPVSDVCWSCMFPIEVGGIVSFNVRNEEEEITTEKEEGTSNPICVCDYSDKLVVGLKTSLYAPMELVETVATPWYMPVLAAQFSAEGDGIHGVNKAGEDDDTSASWIFQNAHIYRFPVFSMMGMFLDSPCLSGRSDGVTDLTVGYVSEIDPMWSSDIMAFFTNPEALVFGNPVTQLACTADAMKLSLGQKPIDSLFWCLGSAGSVYPLTGTIPIANPLMANLALAAKSIYRMGRLGSATGGVYGLMDPGVDVCAPQPTPIWIKSHYRFQIVRPVRGSACIYPGQTDLLWGEGKNPPLGTKNNPPDNFLWMVFRKKLCCLGYSP